MCEEKEIIIVPKHKVTISEAATWIDSRPKVEVTVPEQKQVVIVCKHLIAK